MPRDSDARGTFRPAPHSLRAACALTSRFPAHAPSSNIPIWRWQQGAGGQNLRSRAARAVAAAAHCLKGWHHCSVHACSSRRLKICNILCNATFLLQNVDGNSVMVKQAAAAQGENWLPCEEQGDGAAHGGVGASVCSRGRPNLNLKQQNTTKHMWAWAGCELHAAIQKKGIDPARYGGKQRTEGNSNVQRQCTSS